MNIEILKQLINLAEHGVEHCVRNSHPEEQYGHRDGLQSIIDSAKVYLEVGAESRRLMRFQAATLAMQGILANSYAGGDVKPSHMMSVIEVADLSINMADMLLKRLEQ